MISSGQPWPPLHPSLSPPDTSMQQQYEFVTLFLKSYTKKYIFNLTLMTMTDDALILEEFIITYVNFITFSRFCDKNIFFQVVSREVCGQALLAAHYRVDGHAFINPIQVKYFNSSLPPPPQILNSTNVFRRLLLGTRIFI